MITPVKYVGSKYNLLPYILPLIELTKHQCYVEIFGGSGVVLMNKTRSPVEVYNDLYNDLVCLFRVIRDQPEKLHDKLDITLYSREEWQSAVTMLRTGIYSDEITRAWAVFVAFNQSMGGIVRPKRGGWGYSITRDATQDFTRRIDAIHTMADRLRGVQIESVDFRAILSKYDSPKTIFYIDPPYVKDSRMETGSYWHDDMDELDHIDLINTCLSLSGKFILSGYYHPVYAPLDKNAEKTIIPVTTKVRADGKQKSREEVIWTNIKIKQLTMNI